MDRTPLFLAHGKEIKPSDFLRNYRCSYYNQCLTEAATHNLYLDCSSCRYKGTHVDRFIIDSDPFDDWASTK